MMPWLHWGVGVLTGLVIGFAIGWARGRLAERRNAAGIIRVLLTNVTHSRGTFDGVARARHYLECGE